MHLLIWILLGSSLALSQERGGPLPAPAAIDGVKGVKQEAVSSVKNEAPPTVVPVTPPTRRAHHTPHAAAERTASNGSE